MRVGATLAGIAAVVTALVCAGAAAVICLRAGIENAVQISLAAGSLSGLCSLGALLPFTTRIDRDVERLRAYLRASTRHNWADTLSTSGPLARLRTDMAEALGRVRERLDHAATTVREEQIRRKLSEAERDHAQAIVQALNDAVIVTDPYNDLKMANRRAAELLGFDPELAVNHCVDEVLLDDALRRVIRETLSVATPSHRKTLDHCIVDAGQGADPASSRCFDVTVACLPDTQGAIGGVAGVVTILRDVTREREISQMKSDFVAKASHELRTPLSSINAYIEMLIDGEAETEDTRREFYQIMKNEADRLGRMIDNMLNISRIEAGIVKARVVDMDFVDAASRAIEVIRPQAKLKNIGVKMISGPLVYSAMADPDMMHQVLLNLMSNAVKYTPEGGRVTVTIDNDDATGSVMITIADTGLGIPPDSLDKVFDKFYRIENYKRVAGGTGLGLSLVKHIVETVHRGRISVESKLGMGSRFTCLIPYEHVGA